VAQSKNKQDVRIFITGATGFLGNELLKQITKNGDFVVGTGNSELRLQQTKHQFPNVDLFLADISSDSDLIENIIQKYKCNYIIHCAALKHVVICEENPIRAHRVNIEGSKNIVNLAIKNNIKNVVFVSTDKAIHPSGVYGASKQASEKLFLDHNFTVFQGVNFFFSAGSVLDVWERQRSRNKPLSISSINTIRYFINVFEVVQNILNNLNNHGKTITTSVCYEVKLNMLAEAFCEYHNYYDLSYYTPHKVEKLKEDLPQNINIMKMTKEDIKNMLDNYYNSVK
jgi:FlaA1/EpsC-like NDP-sugar epimerase